MYRIHYVGGLGGAHSGILRLTSKDFKGLCIQAITPSTYPGGITLVKDSLICSGLGTSVSIESSAEGATAGEYLIGFEEYGNSNVAVSQTPEGMNSPVEPPANTTFDLGNTSGFLTSFFG